MSPTARPIRPGEERYSRQAAIFRQQHRQQTLLAEVCGADSPGASRALKAAAAGMGVSAIASDYQGEFATQAHWFLGPHGQLVDTVNPEGVRYECLLPAAPAVGIRGLLPGRENAWAVVYVNDREAALLALEGLEALERLRVLLVLAGPGGVAVRREPCPAAALATARSLSWGQPAPEGTAELQLLAAGACLNELVLGGAVEGDDLSQGRTVAFYSLHRPRRVDARFDAPFPDLTAEVGRPQPGDGPRASFSGRHAKLVGAGALGNWVALAMVFDGAVTMEVLDCDPEVAPHNLNRQVLLIHGLGRGPKAPVLAEELAGLDPQGTYAARVVRVERPEDLGPLDGTDLVIGAPDNDAARQVCADAAQDAGVLFGQGGTGATGGQESVHPPGRPCLRCVLGRPAGPPATGGGCIAVANDSIVSSNMVVAGLLVSELREALGGRRTQNIRFVGDGAGGNRLDRMPTDVACAHRVVGRGARVAERRSEDGRRRGIPVPAPGESALSAAETSLSSASPPPAVRARGIPAPREEACR